MIDIKPPILTATSMTADFETKPYVEPKGTLKEMERGLILDRYWFCNNNQTRTAKSLGIGRSNLRMKLKEYGVL